MPIYEYKCENGHVFDVMQRMADDPLKVCTECGATVQKVMQPVGISFRGSGFYSTDYSGVSQTTPPGESNASKNGGSENDSKGNSENKSENKSNGSSSQDSSKKKPERPSAATSPSGD